MLNNIIVFVLTLLFLYVAVFTAYFTVVVIASFIKKKSVKDDIRKSYKNLIVIIYSHNNEKTIVNLLEQLNKQDYPKGNYQIHIILDNCNDNSSNKLEFVGGAKLWRLTDDTPMGRDKAISWLLENLMSFKKVDGYVFLNANRIVKNDFLFNINEALQNNNVVVGATEIFLENADYYEKVWSSVNEYNTNIMKKGRSNLGLPVPVDSDVMAINHVVLEKVKCIDFNDANAELKYSFLLTKVGFPPKFIPEIKTFVSSIDYEVRRPSFAYKMSLFTHCFNWKAFADLKFIEFLFSLLKPNPLILAGFLLIILTYSFNYYFVVDFPWAIFLAVLLAVVFGVSIYKSELYIKPIFYLGACPFYTLSEIIFENKILRKVFKSKFKKKNTQSEKLVVPVNVTNGRNNFPCYLELTSEGGLKKAVFRYKNKRQSTTQSFVRVCDAVKNISDILEQHGFRIKICQSCAYFNPIADPTNNMFKGFCNRNAVQNENSDEQIETLLWSTCDYFLPQEVNKVIDISEYIKKK